MRVMPKRLQNARQAAEIVAIQALSFIAGEPERLGLFLAETGIGPETLRQSAADPQFLASVLGFIMRDDSPASPSGWACFWPRPGSGRKRCGNRRPIRSSSPACSASSFAMTPW